MTAARLASIASSQSMKNLSGPSATPSRDNSSYNTTLRMRTPPVERDATYSDDSARRNLSHVSVEIPLQATPTPQRSSPLGLPPGNWSLLLVVVAGEPLACPYAGGRA